MSEEWGPWIEHDGKGCTCVGQYCHVVFMNGHEEFGWAGNGRGWLWDSPPEYAKIIRYRIRKPKGMAILESIMREVERKHELV